MRKERLVLARETIEEWKSNFSAYENRIGTLRNIEDFKFIKANKDHYLAMLEKVLSL